MTDRSLWHVGQTENANEVMIEASLDDRRSRFMSATNFTKHRGASKKVGGQACADAYITYAATFDVGAAIARHKPGAREWLDSRGPWSAEPLYDSTKRGQVIIDGKARLILKDKATALLFKLTWG